MARAALSASALLGVLLALVSAHAAKGSVSVTSPDWASAPSVRYASLSAPACRAELRRRNIVFTRVAEAPGVVAPVRIPQGVGGVLYRTALPAKQRATNPHDVFDCRLVLALDDLSRILVAHQIDVAMMFSAWRPPSKKWPAAKEARRHPGAMAVDIYSFGKRPSPASAKPADATGDQRRPPKRAAKRPPHMTPQASHARPWLVIEEHFNGRIGAETCGPRAAAPKPATPEAVELRAIVCEAAKQRIFTSILTPNYDRPHFNHVHFDLTPGARWRIAR